MRRERHFERIVARESNQRDRLAVLLESLRRSAVALEASIEDEEQRTGRSDPSHYAYPIVARAMAQRHDNLKATIAVLERQIGACAKAA
jgi:septal ring factor EnvC (AmiA/AmiB activator)